LEEFESCVQKKFEIQRVLVKRLKELFKSYELLEPYPQVDEINLFKEQNEIRKF